MLTKAWEKLACYFTSHRYELTFTQRKPAKQPEPALKPSPFETLSIALKSTQKQLYDKITTRGVIARSPIAQISMAHSLPREQSKDFELPSTQSLCSLFQHIYYTFTLSNDNIAVSVSTKEPLNIFPSEKLTIFLEANPRGSVKNLSTTFSDNQSTAQIASYTLESTLKMGADIIAQFIEKASSEGLKSRSASNPNLSSLDATSPRSHLRNSTGPVDLSTQELSPEPSQRYSINAALQTPFKI
jgi:hypothetical protein